MTEQDDPDSADLAAVAESLRKRNNLPNAYPEDWLENDRAVMRVLRERGWLSGAEVQRKREETDRLTRLVEHHAKYSDTWRQRAEAAELRLSSPLSINADGEVKPLFDPVGLFINTDDNLRTALEFSQQEQQRLRADVSRLRAALTDIAYATSHGTVYDIARAALADIDTDEKGKA